MKIADRLQEKRIDFSAYQWEGNCKHLYNDIKNYSDIKQILESKDTNTKIFTMSYIIPVIADLISDNERKNLLKLLKKNLSDKTMCETCYAGSSADEEDTTTIASSAELSISKLEALVEK